MRRRAGTGMVFLLWAAATLWAASFWDEKPYQEWDHYEVQTVITNSPWTGAAEAGGVQTRDWGGLSRPERPGAPHGRDLGVGPRSAPAPAGAIAPRAGVPGNDQDESRKYVPGARLYYVLWSSAQTVRQALARNQILLGITTPEKAEESLQEAVEQYRLSIIAQDLTAFEQFRPEELKEMAYLKPRKLKQKLAPLAVEITRSGPTERVASVTYIFARALPSGEPVVRPDERKVDFVCDLKSLDVKIKTTFEPQRMTVKGEPDL